MQYASDGVRLFACGVAAAGIGSTLVEWNESDGAIARRYAGFRNPSQNLARFDSLASRYLIVGDEGVVKVLLSWPATMQMASMRPWCSVCFRRRFLPGLKLQRHGSPVRSRDTTG
jgi:hypothetical protein